MLGLFRRLFCPDRHERALLDRIAVLQEHALELSKMVIQLRAQQDLHEGRLGWRVSAFITEDTLDQLRCHGIEYQERFVEKLARRLVELAVRSLIHRDTDGLSQALCFPPLPTYVGEGPGKVHHRLPNEWERFGYKKALQPTDVQYYQNLGGGDAELDEELRLAVMTREQRREELARLERESRARKNSACAPRGPVLP